MGGPWAVYVDETGHWRESDLVGVAGLVADDVRWRAFDLEWREALASENVRSFHAREFAHSLGAGPESRAGLTKRSNRSSGPSPV